MSSGPARVRPQQVTELLQPITAQQLRTTRGHQRRQLEAEVVEQLQSFRL